MFQHLHTTLIAGTGLTLVAAAAALAAPCGTYTLPMQEGGAGQAGQADVAIEISGAAHVGAPGTPAQLPVATNADVIDLAICLDTSGSMSGLIDAARQKIWAIVNDLAFAQPTPTLRIALLTFGNDGHAAENGWVEVQTGLTEDLDLVSLRLFEQTTNGGTELVGRVIKRSLDDLDWSTDPGALRLMIVAGNESADQDASFACRDMCRDAISRDIMVNSIYCGPVSDAIAPGWREVAMLADGHFAAIDQNNGTIVITTPFDDDLVQLNATLNTTYVPYGAKGEWSSSNQVAQDINASGLNTAAAAQRCVAKGSSLYDNRGWDLVDACGEDTFSLEDVDVETLPEAMQTMTADERRAYVDAKGAERAQVQTRIAELAVQRDAYVQAELRKSALGDEQSFDRAIRDALRAQAESRGFTFPAPAANEAAGDTAAEDVDDFTIDDMEQIVVGDGC